MEYNVLYNNKTHLTDSAYSSIILNLSNRKVSLKIQKTNIRDYYY